MPLPFSKRDTSLRPSFSRDFSGVKTLNHGIGPDITFTRTGTATYFDSAGVLTTATADVPRFDHDPSTLASRGLLIEEGRTNSLRNSQAGGAVVGVVGSGGAFPTNWISSAPTGITREVIGTGTEAGMAYIDIKISGTYTGGGSGYPRVWFDALNFIPASQGQTWTVSFYTKIVAGSTTNLSLRTAQIVECDSGATNQAQSTTNYSLTSSLTKLSHTRTLTLSTTTRVVGAFVFEISNGNSCDLTLRIAAPQLEQGAFATSYIPTTSAAVTRGADVATVTPISSFYNQSEGTLFAEGSNNNTTASAFPVLAQIATNTSTRIALSRNNADNAGRFSVVDNSVAQVATNIGSWTLGNVARLIAAYKINDFAGTVDGASVTIDTLGTVPSATTLNIGGNFSSTQLGGHIRKIAYYPKRLSNARLQNLTV